MQVDIEQGGRARLFVDHVCVPEFFDDGAWHNYFHFCGADLRFLWSASLRAGRQTTQTDRLPHWGLKPAPLLSDSGAHGLTNLFGGSRRAHWFKVRRHPSTIQYGLDRGVYPGGFFLQTETVF